MKLLAIRAKYREKICLVAKFGTAHLVRRFNGVFELRGGTSEERTDACEWISLFMHEAVLQTTPGEKQEYRIRS